MESFWDFLNKISFINSKISSFEWRDEMFQMKLARTGRIRFERIVSILPEKMAIVNTLYQSVFRRSSTFALAIIAGAFGFERFFDPVCDTVFAYINRGVCITIVSVCS